MPIRRKTLDTEPAPSAAETKRSTRTKNATARAGQTKARRAPAAGATRATAKASPAPAARSSTSSAATARTSRTTGKGATKRASGTETTTRRRSSKTKTTSQDQASSASTSTKRASRTTAAIKTSAVRKPRAATASNKVDAHASDATETRAKTKGGGKKTLKSSAAESPVSGARSLSGRDVSRSPTGARRSGRLQDLVRVGQERMGIADLRPGQDEALEAILDHQNVLAVMPTGSGKSLLYQLPSLILPGLTVVVSPLLALIKDQIDKMKALGVAVCRADSSLTVRQKREMEALCLAPGGKLLLTTPERISDPDFRTFLTGAAGKVGVSLFVVDEAHCVSQWGHDFRPSYLTLRRAIEELGNPQVLATTATAPPHVRADILHQLGIPDATIVTTTFDRPNLHFEVIALPGDDEKNRTLVTLLKKLPRPGIVYCATVKMVEKLHESMARHGIPVARYHGRLTKKERDAEQERFMESRDLVMIATNAFGLGVDKPDIRYVLHYHVPGSLEAYAQEAGRAGRDGKPARCVLLFSPDDVAIQDYFLKGTYPTRRQVRAVYKTLVAWGEEGAFALAEARGEPVADDEMSPPTLANLALGSHVGSQRTRTILNLLKDEGFVVESEDNLWAVADPPKPEAELNEKAKQYEARRIADRQRLNALLDYVAAPGCRNQVILEYLGEPGSPVCGRCDNDLRSRDAALAAAREAGRLEASLTHRLDDEEEDAAAKKRVVRARVVRIDGDSGASGEAAAELAPAAAEAVPAAPRPAPIDTGAVPAADQGAFDEVSEYECDEDYEDEDEYNEDYEDEDEYDEDYEDEDEDEDEDYVIDKTAAALAEEGYQPEDAEITILARKKMPKPPKPPRAREEAPPPKKKRRRRRKRKAALPPKSAFTSPVLATAPEPSENQRSRPRTRGGSAGPGPLIEYVRGPLRINMQPVASATPNDQAPGRGKKRKKRRTEQGFGRNGARLSQPAAQGPGAAANGAHPAAQGEAPSGDGSPRKKKRRRRRRRRKDGAENSLIPMDGPITFFSSQAPSGDGGRRKKKRRRRRRGGDGAGAGTGARAGDGGNGTSS